MALLDLNRYRKIYPFIRMKPSIQTGTDTVIAESAEVTFANANSVAYTFTKTFTSTPFVTAIASDSEGNESANVNVFISSVSLTSVTIETSAPFTGVVHIHAIQNLT